jgi:hypothetical protein
MLSMCRSLRPSARQRGAELLSEASALARRWRPLEQEVGCEVAMCRQPEAGQRTLGRGSGLRKHSQAALIMQLIALIYPTDLNA